LYEFHGCHVQRIQEFYFWGMPYPSHLVLNEGNNNKGEATKIETNLDATIERAKIKVGLL
jgi:hypothetical protein